MALVDLQSAYSFYDKPKRFDLPGSTRAESLPAATIRLVRALLTTKGIAFLARQQLLAIDTNTLKADVRTQISSGDINIRNIALQKYGTTVQPDGNPLITSIFDVWRPDKQISKYAASGPPAAIKNNRLAKDSPSRYQQGVLNDSKYNQDPTKYIEANSRLEDIDSDGIKLKLDDSAIDKKIFKEAPTAPSNYVPRAYEKDPTRYRTLTSYTQLRTRAKARAEKPSTNIDFLTGQEFDAANRTQFDYINRTGRGLVELTIGTRSFRSYITSLNDSVEGTWNGEQDQGRADQRYMYAGYTRNISLSFMVAIETSKDLSEFWTSLSYLGQLALPTYTSNGYHGRITKLTIGGLYKLVPVICTSTSYTWDTETPWALKEKKSDGTEVGNDRPMYTEVACEFIHIGDGLQTRNSNLFG